MNEVLYYGHGQAVVDVHFPNKDCVCRWCSLFLRYEEAFKRYSCRLSGEWIFDPFHERGSRCPLILEEDEK